nr:MAG TPA: hypothetical protein [Caudoviricetes sp.]
MYKHILYLSFNTIDNTHPTQCQHASNNSIRMKRMIRMKRNI